MASQMKIYLIEDSPIKVLEISSFVSEALPLASVSVFQSYHSGLTALYSGNPDVVILDMTLPTFDRSHGFREGRLRPLGGYELMRKLRLRGVHSRVIVVTQLETFGEGDEQVSLNEVTERCRREFDGMFVGCIYFDQGPKREWRSGLGRALKGHLND